MRHRRRQIRRYRARRSRNSGRSQGMDGRVRERLVEDGLAILREEGYIRAYYRSVPCGRDDKAGVDAGIITLDNQEIRFQIKGSIAGVRKHLRRHRDIPYVDVGRCVTPAEMALVVQRAFRLFSSSAP